MQFKRKLTVSIDERTVDDDESNIMIDKSSCVAVLLLHFVRSVQGDGQAYNIAVLSVSVLGRLGVRSIVSRLGLTASLLAETPANLRM